MTKIKLFLTLTAIILIATTSAQVPNYLPTNGLIGWWPFNGNANDESGNGYNGTVNGATLTTDRFGNLSNAYSFNGSSNFISLPIGSNIQGNNPRTISSWTYISTTSPKTYTIYKGGGNGTGNDFSIWYRVNSNNTYQVAVRRYVDDIWTDSIPFLSDTWVNITVDYDGTINSNIKIYINGAQHLGRALPGSGLTFNTISVIPEFGHLIDQLSQHFYFQGKLDDIAIWNRALNQQEIKSVFESSSNVGINVTIPQRSLHVKDVLRLEPRNTAPDNPAEGDIYFDSSLKKLRVYDGTVWQNCW